MNLGQRNADRALAVLVQRHRHYRGDRLGIFSYNNATEAGWADFNWFHYRVGNAKLNTTIKEPNSER